MTRGPVPQKALDAALAAAEARGFVSLCQRGRGTLCDIVIHAKGVTVAAMIRRCRRLHAPVAEIEWQFADAIALLRLLPDNPCRSRELWACSPRGMLRFFRVLAGGLAEIDAAGLPLAAT